MVRITLRLDCKYAKINLFMRTMKALGRNVAHALKLKNCLFEQKAFSALRAILTKDLRRNFNENEAPR